LKGVQSIVYEEINREIRKFRTGKRFPNGWRIARPFFVQKQHINTVR